MKHKGHIARLGLVCFFFCLLGVILVWRLIDLTVLHRQFLKGQGDARSLRIQTIPAYRGMITDRQGSPLAVSTVVDSVWINPKQFQPTSTQCTKLAKLLQMRCSEIQSRAVSTRDFVFLKRQLPPNIASHILSLHIPGLAIQPEFKRYYPQASSTAQLIGFTNVDDKGIEGLELAYQEWLNGVPGQRQVVKDRTGRVIDAVGVLKASKPGHDLRLSIDASIQYLAYQALENTLKKFSAKAGSVVVLDAQSGEVLALVNAPSFNPNLRGHYPWDLYRNKAVTDTFEPGSVIKAFSIASALSAGVVKPDTIIDTRSWLSVQGHPIRDIHNYGVLDVTGVLQRSSNIGVTKMTLQSPPEHLIGLLQRAGFGQRTETGYPGESDGSIVSVKAANPFVLATLSFGYGMSVTPLQLAKAYLIFANHGELKPVNLLLDHEPIVATRVIDAKTADQMLAMLEAVLGKDGTGKAARIPGYRVAGKTGTARIAGKKGYQERRYIASFVGIAPVSAPRLVVAVVIKEPTHNGYYAGSVAAPLFADVMSGALRILNVPPDGG